MLVTFVAVALINNSTALPLPSTGPTSISMDAASSSALSTTIPVQPSPYHCQLCSRPFYREEIFRRHMDEHQYGLLTHHCPHCNGQYSDPGQLKQHLKTHRMLTCPECSKEFRLKSGFAIHRSRQACRKVKTCAFCGETFRTTVGLNRHRTQCALSPETNNWCPNCDQDFPTKLSLETHLYRSTDTQQSNACGLCNARLDNPCLQAIHLGNCPWLQEARQELYLTGGFRKQQ
ncbi:hypothetical protein H4R33_001210 [Dimargaris cristalligena]|nr:hypothetical protein H4R33_001210 [Dimargaris cristalligena]